MTRLVCGRAASPYRGTVNEDPHAARDPAPPRSLDEIGAALQAIPYVTTTRTENRFDLRRGAGETLVIACRGETPAFADLTLVGNEYLAILALEALVPLFGAIEFSIAEYRDLVDETERGVAYARYEQFMREKSEQQLAQMEKQRIAFDAARLAAADNLVRPQGQTRTKLWAMLILGFVTLTIVTVWAATHFSKRSVGETCESDGQCRSGWCIHSMVRDASSDWAFDVGVCSKDCASNTDCPQDMQCRRSDLGHARNMCRPRGWAW